MYSYEDAEGNNKLYLVKKNKDDKTDIFLSYKDRKCLDAAKYNK